MAKGRPKVYHGNGDERHSQAVAEYNKVRTVQLPLRFNLKTDADILVKLDTVPSKQGYIKDLIRKDIMRQAKVNEFIKKEREIK